MKQFLQNLKVDLGVKFLNEIKNNMVFMSPINMNCHRKHEAPFWMNVRFQGCVVGVDFCEGKNGTMVVSLFIRSIQNVRMASSAIPQQMGVWLTSCPNVVQKSGGVFDVAFYGSGGWRPICKYDISKTQTSSVVQDLSLILGCFGPIV